MASACPALFRHRGEKITLRLGAKANDVFVKYGVVAFTNASQTEVTSVTSAGQETAIGIALEDLTAASGDEIEVLLFTDGDIFTMINGGTCTAGVRVTVEGTDGRVANVGATPASGAALGVALATSSTDGDYVPVLIALH